MNIMKTSGRGIFYMKTFMDHVDYRFKPNGTELIMIKDLAENSSSKNSGG